jgi:hypothetical protein
MKRRHTLSHSQRLKASLIAIALLTLSIASHAESIKIPVGQQSQQQQIVKPALGMSMDVVKQQFGNPVTQSPARGEPPITRWEYNQFVVYFESEVVIHSVTKHQRKD